MRQNHKTHKSYLASKISYTNFHMFAKKRVNITWKILLCVIIFILTATILFAKADTINDKISENAVATIPAAPHKILTSEHKAKSAVYEISIASASRNDTKDPAFTIPDDETMLIVALSITNNSNRLQDLYPSTQFYVRTRDGLTYGMHPSMYVTSPLQSTQLKPGETIKGEISFALPKSISHPLMYIDLGWNNYVPVVYDILR